MSQSQAWLMLTAGNLPTYNNARVPGKSFGSMTAEDVKHALGELAPAPFAFGMVAFLGDTFSLPMLEEHVQDEVYRMAAKGRWRIDKNHADIVLRMSRLMVWELIAAQSAREVYAHDEQRQSRGEPPVMCPACLGKGRTWMESSAVAHRLAVLIRYERMLIKRVDRARRARKIISARRWHAKRQEAGLAIDTVRVQVARGIQCETCEGTGSFVLTEAKRAQTCGVSERQWREHWSERYSQGIWYMRRLEGWAVGHVAGRLRRDE